MVFTEMLKFCKIAIEHIHFERNKYTITFTTVIVKKKKIK